MFTNTPNPSVIAIRWACRLVVAAVLLFAGLSKLHQPQVFVSDVHAYGLTSLAQSTAIAAVLPWAEVIVGGCLMAGVALRAAFLAALAMFMMFFVAVTSAWMRGLDISCGCFGDAGAPVSPATLLRIVALAGVVGLGLLPTGRSTHDAIARPARPSAVHVAAGRVPAAGFTLAELLVVIGVIGVLVGLLLPVLSGARERGRTAVCLSQMRQIGVGINLYADANNGWAIREYFATIPPATVPWQESVSRMLEEGRPDPVATDDWLVDAWNTRFYPPFASVFFCPSHDLGRDKPGSYSVNAFSFASQNAFSFASQPNWVPTPMTRLARVKNSSELIWVAEAVDFAEEFDDAPPGVDVPEHMQNYRFSDHPTSRDFWRPEHLPGMGSDRIWDVRHVDRANYLHADMSARTQRPGGLRLRMFDDGVR